MFFRKASAPPLADGLLAYGYHRGNELHIATFLPIDQPRSTTTFTESVTNAALGKAVLRHLAEYRPSGDVRMDRCPFPGTLPIRIKTENGHIEFFATRYQVGNLLHVSRATVSSGSGAKSIGERLIKFLYEVRHDMRRHQDEDNQDIQAAL